MIFHPKKVFITNSFEETQKLGEKLGKQLPSSSFARGGLAKLIALCGELGSGKTTFVQGLAKALGIKRRIVSPTFIIVRRYELKAQSSKLKAQNYNLKLKSLERFYHIDLYRVDSVKEIEGLGLEEIFKNPNNIVVIEWAEKMEGLLPKERWDVMFEHLDEDKRKITFINLKTQSSNRETISLREISRRETT